MQPYFFPYLGHFGLIARCDRWVVFDITQYTPKSYMSRNEVLKAGGGRQRIGAELTNSSRSILTRQARIADPERTRQQVLGSLTHYRRYAPHYDAVRRVVNATFDTLATGPDPHSLVQLNLAGLREVCAHLGLPFEAAVASELPLRFDGPMGAGDWAPTIAAQLGAERYLNPAGGRALFDPQQFQRSGVALELLHYTPCAYATPGFAFEPNLSVLDVLMWCAPAQALAHLDQATTVEPC
jgi:hypothetical protein